MDSSHSLGKRTFSQTGVNGGDSAEKRRSKPPPVPGPDSTVYRILCPAGFLKNVIGKGGKVVNAMRTETHAKIIVPSGITEGDERVIIIFSTPRENKEKDAAKTEGEFVCPAQDALVRVHNVIASEHANSGFEDKKRQVSARLLVLNSQTGSLIGKGGNNVQRMRAESGAHIQVQRKEQLPPCALKIDELVVISGDANSVKKGLMLVSEFLHKNPPKDTVPWADIINEATQQHPDSSIPSLLPPGLLTQGGSLLGQHSLGASFLGLGSHLSGLSTYGSDATNPWSLNSSSFPLTSSLLNSASATMEPEDFSLKILCSKDKIGGVIGKGGNTIKTMRQDSGAEIKVEEPRVDADERVILVSAKEVADARVSPVLEAVLLLQGKVSASGDKEGSIVTRLFVPSKQIGCLLGKGGNVIAEMRKKTRAHIKIYSKDERPSFVPENEELVQVTGDPSVVREALIEIVTRLRDNIFKDKERDLSSTATATPNLSNSSLSAGIPLTSSYAPRLDMGSGLERSTLGLGGIGGVQSGIGNYSSLSSYPPTQSSYGSSFLTAGAHAPTEVTVPANAVSSVLGRGGSNIAKIRQLSGANLKVHEPVPGSLDRIIEISGNPEQMNSAYNYVQAFILTGQAQQATLTGRGY